MARLKAPLIVKTGAKLLVAAALGASAMAMTGLPVKLPDTNDTAQPAAPKTTLPLPLVQTNAIAADASNYVIKGALTINSPLKHGDYVWNDDGVPAGPILITVDLAAQTLSIFRAGYEIGVAVIMYGADDKPTPLGGFSITEKDADHVSNLYDAPMPYMMRLTDDGVAIHGSDVKWGGATHGCVGVPTEFARRMFAQVKLGDRVVITNGKRLQVGQHVPTI